MHGSASAYSASVVEHFLANHIMMISATCCTYLTLCKLIFFFLFPKVETAFRGRRFWDIEDIKNNVTAELNVVSTFVWL